MKTIKKLFMLVLVVVFSIQIHASDDGVIRILAIGNSFSQDAIENYLHQLAEASGKKTIIANMYIGGCSLEKHYNNAKDNLAAYSYRKIGVDGVKVTKEKISLETALKDEEWDYVSLQQASPFSGKYETYTPYLADLISYVREFTPKNVKLVWHQTWAYAADCTLSGFAYYDKNQMKMYQAIIEAARQAVKDYGFDILVPVGTAVQNARTTFIGDRMNRDGQHLNVYYGRYTAACTWLEAVLGVNPVGCTFVAPNVNESLKIAAQTAAHEACQDPDAVTDLSYIQQTTGAKAYFVRPNNDPKAKENGDGSSWDNAFTLDGFVSHIVNGTPGDTYYFAGGTYCPTTTINIAEPYTFLGGYDPQLTGTDTPTLAYPSQNPTIFSGDANQSGTFDEGDLGEVFLINLVGTLEREREMRIQGIDFTGAYCVNTDANASLGALHLQDCNNVVVRNCRFYKNKSLGYGGIALRAEYSTTHVLDSEFTDNEAGSRGGAIRLSSNSNAKGYSTFERCLIARNQVADAKGVGSAICVQHAQCTAIVNTTVFGNIAKSGGAVYANGKNKDFKNEVLIISSTFSGNRGDVQLELAGTKNVKIINSILCGANLTTTEEDGNVLDDFATVFGNATLENGVLCPLATVKAGVPVSTLNDTVNGWGFDAADVSLDQLGNHRQDCSFPGAYAAVSTGVRKVANGMSEIESNKPLYSLLGMRISKMWSGIYIQNGKKYMAK
mgnify:CR=1 FL=1